MGDKKEVEESSNIKTNQSYEEWFQDYYKQAGNNSYVASLAAAAATEAVNKEEVAADNLAYYEYYDKYYMNAIKGDSCQANANSSNVTSENNTAKMYDDFYAYWGLHGKNLTDDDDGNEERAYA